MLAQSYPTTKRFTAAFQQWCREGVLRNVLTDLANTLHDKGQIDERVSFIEAMFASAKGGGEEISPTKRGKGVKIMGIVDACSESANQHEVTLVQLSFEFYMIEAMSENLLGDRAYDSDKLDKESKKEGVEMIAPHRSNRLERNKRKRRETVDACADVSDVGSLTLLCVVAVASAVARSLGVSLGQFPRLRPARLRRHPAKKGREIGSRGDLRMGRLGDAWTAWCARLRIL